MEFRVYDKKKKIFMTDDVLMNKNGDLYTVGKSLFGNKLTFLHQDRYVFQKAIELNDKNDTLIYIGDVVEAKVGGDKLVRGVVSFAPEVSGYIILCFDTAEYFILSSEITDRIEVVSNVFEEDNQK